MSVPASSHEDVKETIHNTTNITAQNSNILQGNVFNVGGNFSISGPSSSTDRHDPEFFDQCCAALKEHYDPESDLEKIRSDVGTIVPGTCTWLLRTAEYLSWQESLNSGVLWLVGGPGKGKTTISLLVLDSIRASTLASDCLILNYFCRHGVPKSSATDILMTFILQILVQRPDLFPSVSQNFDTRTHRIMGGKITLYGLWTIVCQLLEKCQAICVLDGIDECPDHEAAELLRCLCGHTEPVTVISITNPSTLKVFISSPPTPSWIPHAVLSANREAVWKVELEVSTEATRKDMELYVDAKIEEFLREDRMRNVNMIELRKKLIEGAEGTFQWVSLACHLIARHGDIQIAFKDASSGLASVLHRLIESHLFDQSADARRLSLELLYTIATAACPLTLSELSILLDIKDDLMMMATAKVEARVRAHAAILSLNADHVRFTHKSIPEYLLRPEIMIAYQQSMSELSYKFTIVCLTLLYDCRVPLRSHKLESQTILLNYAISFWDYHLRDCEQEKLEQLHIFFDKHKTSLKDSAFLQIWWRLSWSSSYATCLNRLVPGKFALSHMAAAFGSTSLLNFAFPSPKSVRECRKASRDIDNSRRTPFSWAIEDGWLRVVEILLPYSDDIDAVQGPYGTALQTAITWGQLDIVNILISKGARLDKGESVWGDPLQTASVSGNIEMVKYLFEQGVDPNSKPHGWFGTALQAAAAKGAEPVVKLLIQNGAEANAEGGWFGSALIAAAAFGHTGIVRLLLDIGGAKITNTAQSTESISKGLVHSKRETFKILRGLPWKQIVDIGISHTQRMRTQAPHDTKAKASLGRAWDDALEQVLLGKDQVLQEQLITAIFGDYESIKDVDIQQRLLTSGFDMYLRSKFYNNALQAAAREGHVDTLKELLRDEHGADMNECVGFFGTPLIAAAAGGHVEIVKTLVDLGADYTIKNSRQQDVLGAARQAGSRQIYDLVYSTWMKHLGREMPSADDAETPIETKTPAEEGKLDDEFI